MKGARVVALAGVVLLGAGGGILGREVYLEAKAMLAERLIARAFEEHLRDGEVHRPWSWADMHPVALLEVPRLGIRRHVLSGASGSSMAFGPGHVDGTAPPNGPGNCVLAGHRDSWFRFLRDLRPGDEIRLTTSGKRTERWVVRSTAVAAQDDLMVAQPTPAPRLTLVTCWPFDGLLHSPWRFVVAAEPVGRCVNGTRPLGDRWHPCDRSSSHADQ